MRMRNLLFLVGIILFLAGSELEASPAISFIEPTTPDSAQTEYAQMSISIEEQILEAFSLNWAGKDYPVYDSSLVLLLNFNNNPAIGESATSFRDISSYSNNATCSGSSCPAIGEGKFGSGAQFDGVNDHVNIPKSASLNITDAITIEAWTKGNNQHILYSNSFFLSKHTSQMMFAIRDREANEADINGWIIKPITNSIDGEWHHFAGTYSISDRTMRGYVDGRMMFSFTTTGGDGKIDTPSAFTIGKKWAGEFFNGTLDEVRVYNRALSAEEIKIHYRSEFKKYDNSRWGFYANISNNGGEYSYYGKASDTAGNSNTTETRRVILFQAASVRFDQTVGDIRSDFYGADVDWNDWLRYGHRADVNGDGVLNATEISDTAWHRQKFLEAGLRYARSAIGLQDLYGGFTNSGFEEWFNASVGSVDATTKPKETGSTAWRFSISNNTTGFISQSADAHSGNYSLSASVNSGAGSMSIIYNSPIKLTSGKTYNLSGWFKVNGTVRFGLQKAGGDWKVSNSTTITEDGTEWKLYSITANTFDPTYPYRILIDGINNNESLLIDDVSIAEDGVPMTWWRLNDQDIAARQEEYRWARASGVKILEIIIYMPTFLADISGTDMSKYWLHGGGYAWSLPKDYDLFATLVLDYINRSTNNGEYLDVVEYEMWNEPNGNLLSLYPKDDPRKAEAYVRLSNAVFTKLLAAYPNIVIGGPVTDRPTDINMNNAFLSNFSDKTKFYSFHRYSRSPFKDLPSDVQDALSRLAAYNVSNLRIIISEWNLNYRNLARTLTDEEQAALYAAGYAGILNSYPSNVSMLLWTWSHQPYAWNWTIDNTDYAQWYGHSYKWYMIKESALGEEYRPSFNVTKAFAGYHSPGSTVVSSNADYPLLKTVASKKGGSEYITIINLDSEAVNVKANLYASNFSSFKNLETGQIYALDGGKLSLSPLPAFGIMHLQGERLAADVNQDGSVDILDLRLVALHFGEATTSPYPRYDVNSDATVDILDLRLVAGGM